MISFHDQCYDDDDDDHDDEFRYNLDCLTARCQNKVDMCSFPFAINSICVIEYTSSQCREIVFHFWFVFGFWFCSRVFICYVVFFVAKWIPLIVLSIVALLESASILCGTEAEKNFKFFSLFDIITYFQLLLVFQALYFIISKSFPSGKTSWSNTA